MFTTTGGIHSSYRVLSLAVAQSRNKNPERFRRLTLLASTMLFRPQTSVTNNSVEFCLSPPYKHQLIASAVTKGVRGSQRHISAFGESKKNSYWCTSTCCRPGKPRGQVRRVWEGRLRECRRSTFAGMWCDGVTQLQSALRLRASHCEMTRSYDVSSM